MAFAHVTAVIESGLPMLEKLVALAIAESASRDTDQAWLSWDTIAQRASSSRRGAQTAFERLAKAGMCTKVGQRKVPRGYVWIFQINIDRLPPHVPDPTDAADASLEERAAETQAGRGVEGRKGVTGAAAASLPENRHDRWNWPPTGARGASVRDARDDTRDAPGARVGMQEVPSRDAPGASKSVPMNQVSEPVHGRTGPGLAPDRPALTPEEERELRCANSSARNLGIPLLQPGETLAAFNARIGEANLARLERIRLEHTAPPADPFPAEASA